ncbi:hypothetical protein V6Z11_D05G357400 [Gossypium hirsutum]
MNWLSERTKHGIPSKLGQLAFLKSSSHCLKK